MKKLFNITNILIFIIIITLIIIVSLIIHTKNIYNNKINKLEESINIIQEDIELIFNNTQSNTEELKVLVAKENTCSGMPGPNGGSSWGNIIFIASNGWVYEYEYDEYEDLNSYYPKKDNLTDLSTFLITSSKKTNNKISSKELSLLNNYINLIKTENLKKIETEQCIVTVDAWCNLSLNIFNYESSNKINISSKECGTYYTSPSIGKILNIINKYL